MAAEADIPLVLCVLYWAVFIPELDNTFIVHRASIALEIAQNGAIHDNNNWFSPFLTDAIRSMYLERVLMTHNFLFLGYV